MSKEQIIPHNFIIVEYNHPETPNTKTHKLLAGWSGSYLYGSSWRLNSGIKSIDYDGKFYYVHGYSGSTYQVAESAEGMLSIMIDIYEQIKKMAPELKIISIQDAYKIYKKDN